MTDRQHAAQLAAAAERALEVLEVDTITVPRGDALAMLHKALAAWDRHTTERTEQQLPLEGL